MERPQVSIIENQSEYTQQVSISESERIALLVKYGFKGSDYHHDNSSGQSSEKNPTFEEMISMQEQNFINNSKQKRREIIPSYSIDQNNVRFYESKYKTFEEDSNFGFEVRIVSDMNIPKY